MLRKIILSAIFVFALAHTSLASTIVMKNGDKITGEVTGDNGKHVAIKSEFFGELVVKKENIDTISDDAKAAEPAPEPVLTPIPKVWDNKLSASYNTTNGNTKTTAANVTLDSTRTKGRKTWQIKNSLDYAADHGRMTTQKYYGKAKREYRLSEGSKWFETNAVEVNHDKFAGIDYRVLPSIGLGYWFWEGEQSKSESDLGIGYEYTNYNTTDTKSTGNVSLIPHYYIDYTIFKKVKISEDFTIYPSLSRLSDYRFRSETSLISPLSNTLSLKLSFLDEFNSNPKGSAKKNDTTLLTGILYAF